jgi:hypothetical protein
MGTVSHAVAEDPVSDALAQVTPLPGARHNHLMQDLGGGEYLVAGGQVEMGGVQAPATFVFHYTGDAAGGYGTWREGPPLPSFSTPSGPSSFIRGQAELEYGVSPTARSGSATASTRPSRARPSRTAGATCSCRPVRSRCPSDCARATVAEVTVSFD